MLNCKKKRAREQQQNTNHCVWQVTLKKTQKAEKFATSYHRQEVQVIVLQP